VINFEFAGPVFKFFLETRQTWLPNKVILNSKDPVDPKLEAFYKVMFEKKTGFYFCRWGSIVAGTGARSKSRSQGQKVLFFPNRVFA
jgi:hypothetical protein